PRVGPHRSPLSFSDALRCKTAAYVRCSRTSEPIRLSHVVRKTDHTTGSEHSRLNSGRVIAPGVPGTLMRRSSYMRSRSLRMPKSGIEEISWAPAIFSMIISYHWQRPADLTTHHTSVNSD